MSRFDELTRLHYTSREMREAQAKKTRKGGEDEMQSTHPLVKSAAIIVWLHLLMAIVHGLSYIVNHAYWRSR